MPSAAAKLPAVETQPYNSFTVNTAAGDTAARNSPAVSPPAVSSTAVSSTAVSSPAADSASLGTAATHSTVTAVLGRGLLSHGSLNYGSLGHWATMVAGNKSIVSTLVLVVTAAWISGGGMGQKSDDVDSAGGPLSASSSASVPFSELSGQDNGSMGSVAFQDGAPGIPVANSPEDAELFVNLDLSGLPEAPIGQPAGNLGFSQSSPVSASDAIPALPKINFSTVFNAPYEQSYDDSHGSTAHSSESSVAGSGISAQTVSTTTKNPLDLALQNLSGEADYGLAGSGADGQSAAISQKPPVAEAQQTTYRETKTPRGIADWTDFLPPPPEPSF